MTQLGTGPVETVVAGLAIAAVATSAAFATLGTALAIAASAHKSRIFKPTAPLSPYPRKQLNASIRNINLVQSSKALNKVAILFRAARDGVGGKMVMTGSKLTCWVMLIGTLALPVQAAQPHGLKPAGNPGDWVTPDDYPPAALRANRTGLSGFRLSVDTAGHVVSCTITSTSGSADLDQTTCRLLTERASFMPATGPNGQTIAATYSSAVHWQIPHGDSAADKSIQAATMLNCILAPNDIKIATVFGCS